jgi:drug/metabolite transporter (DMT)-like permease
VTSLAIALVLVSACFHAGWNILLKGSADPLRLSAQAIPLATVAVTPFAVGGWLLSGRPLLAWQALPLAALSGLAELAYFRFLSEAYRKGEISSVYPIARGTAPLLAVVFGLVVLGERLHGWQLIGAGALIAGIWLARPPSGASRAALAPALFTGLFIAVYTSLDRIGVRLGPAWLYGWVTFVSMSLWLLPFRGREPVGRAAVIGLLSLSAYSLVLLALAVAPLALIAPLRESGVVLVALWGVFRMGERERGALKLVGAAAVLTGAFLLATG